MKMRSCWKPPGPRLRQLNSSESLKRFLRHDSSQLRRCLKNVKALSTDVVLSGSIRSHSPRKKHHRGFFPIRLERSISSFTGSSQSFLLNDIFDEKMSICCVLFCCYPRSPCIILFGQIFIRCDKQATLSPPSLSLSLKHRSTCTHTHMHTHLHPYKHARREREREALAHEHNVEKYEKDRRQLRLRMRKR